MNARRDTPASEDARVKAALGQRIKRRREALKLTQKQLGERLVNANGNPIPGEQVSKWERGQNLPARSRWGEVAAALEWDTSQLLEGIIAESEAGAILEDRVTELEARVEGVIQVLGISEAVAGVVRAQRRIRPAADADDSGEPGGERWDPPAASRRGGGAARSEPA